MSLWNGILQAVHSSLIDELNVRWPDDKLELGLPKRVDGWALSSAAETAIVRAIACAEGKGAVAIGTKNAQSISETKAVFEALVIRATREFKIRSLDARFEGWLTGAPPARMTIWLPIRIPQRADERTFDLGVAVFA